MLKRTIERFLAAAARRAIRRDKPVVVAITGSLGKSSTKEAIAVALGARESGSRVRASLKNYNNEFGVPLTVLDAESPGKDMIRWLNVFMRALWAGWGFGHVRESTLILEMGADHKGDLSWLVGIAPPDVSVVTAVAPAHTEFLGTVEEVAEEKSTLVRALKEDGVAILNNDDTRVTSMRKLFSGQAIYFGESEGSDARVLSTSVDVDSDSGIAVSGMRVTIGADGKVYEVHLKGTIGRPQAWAVAAAFAVAMHFKIPFDDIISRLERDYHGIAGRTRIIEGIKRTTIIDDSYNAASSQAVISALRDISAVPVRSSCRRIAALGDMRELGEYSDEAHRMVGREAAIQGIDALITCGTLARTIADAAKEAGMDPDRIHSFDTSEEGGRFLQDFIRKGDVLLVKGSQGSRMEKIVKELMAEPLQAPFLLVRMTKDWLG